MRDIYFSKDRVAVVGEHNTAHGIQKHLQHGAGTQRGANDVRDRLETGRNKWEGYRKALGSTASSSSHYILACVTPETALRLRPPFYLWDKASSARQGCV
eukprot:scaffold1469_cov257-Pinguiococcus_pyrenoidosus.AAC.3